MFSDNSIRKILKKAGAKKISKTSINKFKRKLEAYSYIEAKKAIKNAFYSGRKTIKSEDIE